MGDREGEAASLRALLLSVSRDAGRLTTTLLDEFGSLGAVLSASRERLAAVAPDRVVRLLAAVRAAHLQVLSAPISSQPLLSSSSSLLDYLRVAMADRQREQMRVLYLTARNELIRDEVVTEGSAAEVPIYPPAIVKRALELGAVALILVHNHPSGDPTPSASDVAATRRVVTAAAALDIRVHDHLVVARSGVASLASLGLLHA